MSVYWNFMETWSIALIKMRMYIVLTYISLHIVFYWRFYDNLQIVKIFTESVKVKKERKKTEYYEIEYLTHKSQYEPAEQMRILAHMLGCTGSSKSKWVFETSLTVRNIWIYT